MTRRPPTGHAGPLLPGGRVWPAASLFVASQGANALLRAVAYTTYGLYAVKTAGLGPLELESPRGSRAPSSS